MARKKTFADDFMMREIAMDILKTCGGEREIILQVQRVMNSRIDTLSADAALQQLEALRTRCGTSSEQSSKSGTPNFGETEVASHPNSPTFPV